MKREKTASHGGHGVHSESPVPRVKRSGQNSGGYMKNPETPDFRRVRRG